MTPFAPRDEAELSERDSQISKNEAEINTYICLISV